jgi:hypothetical protein
MSNSIGDLRNSGNQGNNFPWQLKVLQGLQALINSSSSSSTCCEDLTTLLQPQPRKANIERVTSGPLAIAGPIYSYSVANVGTGNGTVLGVTIKPGEIVNFDAGTLNNTFTSTEVDGTGTELLVTYITS